MAEEVVEEVEAEVGAAAAAGEEVVDTTEVISPRCCYQVIFNHSV